MQKYKSEKNKQKALSKLRLGWKLSRKRRKIERNKKIEQYLLNPNKCTQCLEVIPFEKRENKFCSRSCGATYNNNNPSSKRKRVPEKFCENCGDKLINKYSKNTLYCSMKCGVEKRRKILFEKIERNETVSSDALRRYLMKKHSEKCSICGWGERNPVSETVCLDMHHIDGDHKNNRLSNVELICPNCHAITENYKRVNYNRKSSRNRKKQ